MISFGSRLKQSVLYRAANILSPKDKLKVFLVILTQIFLGLLDLVGVGLIGVIGSLAINGVSARQPGDRVQWLLNQLRLGELDLQSQTIILAAVALSVLVFKTLLSMILMKRILYFLSFRGAQISSNLVGKLLSQPLLRVQSKSSQETLFALTSGVNSVTIGILATFVSVIADSSLLLILSIGLFVIDPLLASTTFILFSVVALCLYIFMQVKVRDLGRQNRQTEIESNALILEVLSSYRELVVKNRRFHYSQKIGEQRHLLAGVTAALSFMPSISKYVFEIAIVIGGLVISAIQFVTNDPYRAVTILSIFFAASGRIAPAVLRIQQSSITIKGNAPMAEPTLELIESLSLEEESNNQSEVIDFEHEGFTAGIELCNVSLTYPGKNVESISEISLKIEPGEVVAIVGPSGAGKTTLIDLMLGVLEPDVGSVYLSGVRPLDAISFWPGAIGYMPQDILILSGTVRENIMLGFSPKKIYESQVFRALSVAQLHDFVATLPKGLEETMGERGTRMSGGQRQRLGIARALFTSPKLLVLDEATSSLDGETEANISEAIRQMAGQVTIVMIAHRLSTVMNAERVIYLDSGKIVAEGTFEQVRSAVPDFDKQARLMSIQGKVEETE